MLKQVFNAEFIVKNAFLELNIPYLFFFTSKSIFLITNYLNFILVKIMIKI